MGVFDFLFRRSPSNVTPEQLRERLFEAVAAGDDERVAELCAAHEETVLTSFAGWQQVPDEYRTPDRLAWYGPGLIAVARHFAEERGHPELLQRLLGPPDDNPLLRWRRLLGEVDALMAEHRYEEAAQRLRAVLEETEGQQGSGVDAYLPVVLGRLGECLMQCGDTDGARGATERALARCIASGDADGVVAYLGNLYEVHRYRGDSAAAAGCLDRLAAMLERLGRRDDAVRTSRQAEIVRAGEPLCRVVADIDGETRELSDLSGTQGRVRFVFKRNRIALRRCTDAVEKGVQAAERGQLEAALACFVRAAAADAFDPWPRYHAGMVQLELRRYADASASFRATEALAPGWYQCRSDLWLAERLEAGALDHETFMTIRALSDGDRPPAEAVVLATTALQRGELGVLRLHLGDALRALGRDPEAEDAYRRGLAVAEEPDIRTRLLVALAAIVPASKTRLLHEAIEVAGNLVAAAMARTILASSSTPS
jgi:tetratricopeptide (TPR) repeat protein